MISNIPEELQKLQQWVCFDIEDEGKKVPYTPGTDSMAASNRPRDWRSFRAACKDVEEGKRQHIGFCFSSSDPYTFVDLDDTRDPEQKKVFDRLKTYAQYSVSGNGVHLICNGSFDGPGKHPKEPHAGIFKENRFCLMTGDIVDDRSSICVVDDADLQAIHTWLGGGTEEFDADLVEYQTEIPDQTVFNLGCDRFDKFYNLCNGDWQQYEEYHNDHSTADYAFIAMLADLTESNEQVRWFFENSGMWNAERAAKKAGHGLRGYVDRSLKKIRGKQAREREVLSRVALCFTEEKKEPIAVEVLDKITTDDWIASMPDGLIKDTAKYSMATAFYPLPEAAIAAAITLFSGIAGRAYLTPTMTGLNMWTVLVGGTSCGKDEFQQCMNRILGALGERGLKSAPGLLGGELVSGPALEKVFTERKRYISYMPEFGDLFKTLTSPAAADHIRTLHRGLLNSYNATNPQGMIRARRKAEGTESGVDFIERPCLVLAGESTPEALYGNITLREVATGFLQRFNLIDVARSSWSMTENPQFKSAPPAVLLDRMEQLLVLCDSMEVANRRGGSYNVVDGSDAALQMLLDYRSDKRRQIMECSDGLAVKEVINRAGLKVLRWATLFAVARDMHAPRIEEEDALWAIRYIDQLDKNMLDRFSSGDLGSGQTKQEAEIRKAVDKICSMSAGERRKLGMNEQVAASAAFFPLSVLKEQVVHHAAFANDKLGAVTALERCVGSLVRSGVLNQVGEDYAMDNLGHTKGILLCKK